MLTSQDEAMAQYEDELDNICEGCGVRNTGSNFSHAGLCKTCMGGIMGAPEEELLSDTNEMAKKLAANVDEKQGPLTTWKDQGSEVEVLLPIPLGVTKKQLVVKVTRSKITVHADARQLLRVDPLYDELAADEMTWLLETGKDGGVVLQISVEKAHPQTRFGKTLCKEGGAFECWLTEK